METEKMYRALKAYSSTVHGMVRTVLQSDTTKQFSQIRLGLWLNPLPYHVRQVPRPVPFTGEKSVQHIQLIESPDIGVYSKMIVWNPLESSSAHFHENTHCFFTGVHTGLQQTIHSIDGNETTVPVNIGLYSYLHDTIGSHSMKNLSGANTCVSYHLYIDDDTLRSDSEYGHRYASQASSMRT